ncbi:MAG: Wzz/FepE/Etk N-terminal domain-containing protein [Acidobacteriota bacterium]|nr:Wzz/FepE/Etk N-terminal domain-containing protein [Acidobacteriota bacterium]
MNDYEIGIVDLAAVLRKNKKPIAAATLIGALAAAVFLFARPRTWEIEAVFYPARITAANEKGEIINTMVHSFPSLVNQLENREFDPYVSKKGGLPIERIPRFHVARIKGTNQVRFHLQDTDIKNSKLALTALLQILETDQNNMLDAKLAAAESVFFELDTKASTLEARIRKTERDILALERERRDAESRARVSLDEENTLSQKIRGIEGKIAGLEERQTALTGRSDPDAAREEQTVSNLILAHAMMAGTHAESVKSERMLREDLNRKIAEIVDQRGRLESRVASLRNELSKISATRARQADIEAGAIRAHLLTSPSTLSRPVSHRSPASVILGAALGFLLSFFPAVFIEIGKRAAQG